MTRGLDRVGSGILAARVAGAHGRFASAPSEWVEWARAELSGLPEPCSDAVDQAYDRSRAAAERERLGQVFTPTALARALARLIGVERPGTVLDPAAGDGSLLLAVAEHRLAHGGSPGAILDALTGWDLDPVAADLCRVALVCWGLDHADGPAPGRLDIRCVDGLQAEGCFGFVISNPPYLEAKRMGRAQPGLRERLRAQFPDLTGAFDLYLAFALRALERAPVSGLILPNKVCQGRYARLFRARVAREGRLAGLLDLSRVTPRPFPGTSVYPVLLHLEAAERVRVARCSTAESIGSTELVELSPASLSAVGGESPWFVPFDTWPLLEPLFGGARLGQVARLATTCSFHKRGLRELFVTPDRPDEHAWPYLGGPSRTRKTEVQPFEQRWAGWWIRFDQRALKTEHKNPIPPLARFAQPKVLFNQHDRRMSAWADEHGRFVSKDVYPIAWPEHPAWTLWRLTGLLNSTVFSALYNTVYQGIVVGGETYHYLPSFLSHVPVPDGEALAELDEWVPQMQLQPSPDGFIAIDRCVARAYGLDEAARRRLVEVHLQRVGARYPSEQAVSAAGSDGPPRSVR